MVSTNVSCLFSQVVKPVLIIFMMVDLKMPRHLAGLAAFPFYFHWRPDAECQHRDEGVAEIAFHLHQRHTIGIEGVTDGSSDLFGILYQPPEKGVGRPGVELRAGLGMGGNTVGVTAVQQ